MLKRIFFLAFVILCVYGFHITNQIQFGLESSGKNLPETHKRSKKNEAGKIFNFEFTKFSTTGEKELEIQGESADMFAKVVELQNVIAKAYQEETPITITADEGKFDRQKSVVFLRKNVVATTDDGGRLLTEALDIYPEENMVKSDIFVEVFQDEMHLQGVGLICKDELKEIDFFKDVQVVFAGEENENTIITCDGKLHINYNDNTARFHDNVFSKDPQGTMESDFMDVYYDDETREVSKIHSVGDVVLDQNGSKTYSDSVIYLADEGRVILEGDPEAYGFTAAPIFEEN